MFVCVDVPSFVGFNVFLQDRRRQFFIYFRGRDFLPLRVVKGRKCEEISVVTVCVWSALS